VIYSALITLCSMGISAMILGIIFASGPGLLAAAGVAGVTGLGMLILHGSFLYKGMQKGEKGRHHHYLLWASNFVLFGSLITVSMLSGGMVPMSVWLLVGLPWLILNIVVHYNLYKRAGIEEEVHKKELERRKVELMHHLQKELPKILRRQAAKSVE